MTDGESVTVFHGSCRVCGRVDADGMWYRPCPHPDCPSGKPKQREMGYCPKCGESEFEFDENGSDIKSYIDGTPFPTVTLRFVCGNCSHAIEVEYDRDDDLHRQPNNMSGNGYDHDPDGNLDEEDED